MKYKYNTRFNPTISGPLHLGHLYISLVNATEAHCNNGEFIVRVDDTQGIWNQRFDKKLRDQYYNEYQEQLSRFMKIDTWHLQSQMPSAEEIIGDNPILKALPKPAWYGTFTVEWRALLNQIVWQYSPYMTAEKTIWDFWEGVSLLIRGDDLLSEANLYEHFVELFGLPRIPHVYVPRLAASSLKDEVKTVEAVKEGLSKTFGKYRLATQLDEFSIEEILHRLKKSCLIDPEGEFLVENIKMYPIMEGFKA